MKKNTDEILKELAQVNDYIEVYFADLNGVDEDIQSIDALFTETLNYKIYPKIDDQ